MEIQSIEDLKHLEASTTVYGLTAGDTTMVNRKKKQAESQSDTVFKQDKVPLSSLGIGQYKALLKTGMMFELYPNATGDFKKDCLLKR